MSVTRAAEAADVTRETVPRWVHRDPVSIAELENSRAELAAQPRLGLEALGMRAVANLRDPLQNNFMLPRKLRAACAEAPVVDSERIAPEHAPEASLPAAEERIGGEPEHEPDARADQAEAAATGSNVTAESNDRPSTKLVRDMLNRAGRPVPPFLLDACRHQDSVPEHGGRKERRSIGLAGPLSNHASSQSVESVPRGSLEQMQAFARRWRDEYRGSRCAGVHGREAIGT